MKRSEINRALREMEEFCRRERCYLPPFCSFTPEEWREKGHEYDEVKATLRDRQEYTAKRPGGGRFRLFVFVFSSRLRRRDFLFSEDMRMLQFDKVKRISCGRPAMPFIGDNCADLVRLHRNPNVFTPGYCD